MRMRNFLLPTLALLLIAGSAHAQPPPHDTADVHFRLGRDAAKRGDYELACAELTQSQLLEPAGGTLLNLGDCEEHLGHLARAWQHFVDARAQLPADDDRTKIVIDRAAS